MEYVRSKRVSLKAHPQFNEKWLQQQITTDSTLLGLGDLDVKDVERRQPRAGRLDVLLFDADTNTRYEVEIQLGPTDESHIIRTLEYWDNERRRFPQYEHIAVIVAEEITGRFLNVINLFNQAIPLIAVQMSALEVQGSLHRTTVTKIEAGGRDIRLGEAFAIARALGSTVDGLLGTGDPKELLVRAAEERAAAREALQVAEMRTAQADAAYEHLLQELAQHIDKEDRGDTHISLIPTLIMKQTGASRDAPRGRQV
jgi:hypothetical protein